AARSARLGLGVGLDGPTGGRPEAAVVSSSGEAPRPLPGPPPAPVPVHAPSPAPPPPPRHRPWLTRGGGVMNVSNASSSTRCDPRSLASVSARAARTCVLLSGPT